MFAPPVAYANTKAGARFGAKTPSLALLAPRFSPNGVEQAPMLQRSIGNQATLRVLSQPALRPAPNAAGERHDQETGSMPITQSEVAPGASWNFAPDPTVVSRACLCAGNGQNPGRPMQTSLKISQPEDSSELEADRVADEVMRALSPPPPVQRHSVPGAAQRKCESCARAEQTAPESDRSLITRSAGSGGEPLDYDTRVLMESRLGRDFGGVRIHAGADASEAARRVSARAYTIGSDIVFGAGQYAPGSSGGLKLIAHELAHVVQQGHAVNPSRLAVADAGAISPATARTANATIFRDPVFPDSTCDQVKNNIIRAWPTARSWASVALGRLTNAVGVRSLLQRHFKLDSADTAQSADLATVITVFTRMKELFDTDIAQHCAIAASSGYCSLPDGRIFAAWVHSGIPADGITHCLESADVSLLGGKFLIETLVHEVAHLADTNSDDWAYLVGGGLTTYAQMTRAQAIRNADSYAQFAKEIYVGTADTPVVFGLTPGAMLSAGRPRFAVTASLDFRSRSGIEVFDLIGGVHAFISLDPAAGAGEPTFRNVGLVADIGVLSRSPRTHFFADTRIGAFGSVDLGTYDPSGIAAGLTARALLGWADSNFRAGVDLRLLYDFLHGNNAVIFGGEFSWGP
jgi:hypothetical protein